jgi:hypothetical protein
MAIDLVQVVSYVGFALLGWWLRHQGLTLPGSTPAPAPAAASPFDQKALIELLKTLLDRLAAPPSATPSAPSGNVVHVPIEVATNVKQP